MKLSIVLLIIFASNGYTINYSNEIKKFNEYYFNLFRNKNSNKIYYHFSEEFKKIISKETVGKFCNQMSTNIGGIKAINKTDFNELQNNGISYYTLISDFDTEKERLLFKLELYKKDNDDKLNVNGFVYSDGIHLTPAFMADEPAFLRT